MSDPAIVERFLAAFGTAEMAAMRELLAPDLLAWVANADGEMDRVERRDGYLERTLHNFAAHLLRLPDNQIAEWWMADAKPAESDAFWGA